jgi:hypothetical protein
MPNSHIYFGETVPGYDVPVLNEREVRAAAGVLFLLALISFMNAFLLGDYQPIKAFVTVFFIDFVIRVLVNPKYAPSLLLGRLAVRGQQVEYAGAPQKRFAWGMGLGLSTIMFLLVVVFGVIGPLNLLLCLLCLTLMFCESAFGVCLGCKMYEKITKRSPQLCPGGSCEIFRREPIQQLSSLQTLVLAFGLTVFVGVATAFLWAPVRQAWPFLGPSLAQSGVDCEVPGWAKAIGHEELYRRHHGCLEL